MSYSSSKNHKSCATCGCWNGERKTDTVGNQVIVDGSLSKGKCSMRNSPNIGKIKNASDSCSKWDKWGALK